MSRVYIAGPMTGLPEFNFPAFHAAAKAWREAGWEVFNPAESFDGRTDLAYRDYVAADLTALRSCDAIAMLDGWDGENARGSVWEREICWALLKIPVYDAASPVQPHPRESICAEADRLVATDRQAVYGHPFDDFTKTGRLWAVVLGLPEVTPEQVALCMAMVKVSRLLNSPDHRDSHVDLCGYAKTHWLVRERRAA
jgi:hypothetical protein